MNEFSKIFDGDHPDIGRIIPFIGQLFGDRCISGPQQLHATGPMTEIWKTDDSFFADAHDSPNQRIRLIDLLQRLAQNDIIKSLVGIIGDFLVDISLKHR